ncbi:hypothetical protein Bcep18194_A4327 [Burkholderia lata]|uniref:Uncharacterized protein n=1 Tax=Burkholderia lata (strain ATCC 17760 / DSM 23089 / LMG 22485 / NCIMB 9086 / R18194 / 383) TaxID=482957 RepID=Q39HZ3_BURL3|nr:hypothetical protein Bcep18194_A4327 [Burkholderia lata]
MPRHAAGLSCCRGDAQRQAAIMRGAHASGAGRNRIPACVWSFPDTRAAAFPLHSEHLPAEGGLDVPRPFASAGACGCFSVAARCRSAARHRAPLT